MSEADKIACLICGRQFRFLPPHLLRLHGVSADEYRQAYAIPAGTPLAGASYCAAASARMTTMRAEGIVTSDHLPQAVEAARNAGRGHRTADDLARQAERIRAQQPWEGRRLPPGSKLADGRDADIARAAQRRRRASRKPG